MKKTNNKGFSLVELIIVVAIMAILIGVLAPQYIKYVEKSRVSADNKTADDIVSAVRTALADEAYQEKIGITTNAASFGSGGIKADTSLVAALEEYLGFTATELATRKPKSKLYSSQTFTVAITEPVAGAGYVAKGAWSGATPATP